MQHIKDLIAKMKASQPRTFTLVFHRKQKNSGYTITEQDKKHIRMIATLKFARDGVIQEILDHEFTETFKYIKERDEVVYTVKLKKEGGHKEYANC